jgi:hypothetical protein
MSDFSIPTDNDAIHAPWWQDIQATRQQREREKRIRQQEEEQERRHREWQQQYMAGIEKLAEGLESDLQSTGLEVRRQYYNSLYIRCAKDDALPLSKAMRVNGQYMSTGELYVTLDERSIRALRQYADRHKDGDGNNMLEGMEGFRVKPVNRNKPAVKPPWLIEKVLLKGAPAVVGGPMKSLKTSVLIDLLVSLASGKPFLGHFAVPKPVRAYLMSGEIGAEAQVTDIVARVTKAKGVSLDLPGFDYQFQVPALSDKADLDILTAGLIEQQVDVLGIDPIYLYLLAGEDQKRTNMANSFDLGMLLKSITQAVLKAGTTPIFCYHSKALKYPNGAMKLEDLAYPGAGQFFRQWLLLNHRKPFQFDIGRHDLWMTVGSPMWGQDQWAVDVREGVADQQLKGRFWEVTVLSPDQAKDLRKSKAKADKLEADEPDFFSALDQFEQPPSKTKLREILHWGKRFNRVYDTLLAHNAIEEIPIMVASGKGASRSAMGVRRKHNTQHAETL